MNPELQAFGKCRPLLELSLKQPNSNLMNFLAEEGFITSETRDTLQNKGEDYRATELTKYIRDRVALESENYHVLLHELKVHGKHYQPVVNKLEEEYKKQGKSIFN